MKAVINYIVIITLLATHILFAAEREVSYMEYAPCAVAASMDGSNIYVACERQNAIWVLKRDSNKYIKDYEIKVPGCPNGIAISNAGDFLFATCGCSEGKLVSIDLHSRNVISSVSAGHTPMAPVLTPDGKSLYLCSRYTNSILKFGVSSGALVRMGNDIPAIREPVASAITKDGKLLFAVNHLPDGAATSLDIAAKVSVLDLSIDNIKATISLPVGSTSLKGVAISPDGKYAYVSHMLARFTLPTTQLDRGWMNTNALSVIDTGNLKLVNTVLLDEADLGAANPWGVCCSPDGKLLCVAHSGTHEVSLVDLPALHSRLNEAAAGKQVTPVTSSKYDVPNDLSFLAGIRKRISLSGNGPREVYFTAGNFVTTEYFTDSISSISPEGSTEHFILNPELSNTQIRKGEQYFHDAKFCFQQWQSCASCHPGDARVDGLNWDLLNDGIGNPKNTSSMLYSHATPPAMITGVRANAETAVRAGMKYIQFVQRSEEELCAIDEYLKSLKPVPSPYLVNGKLSEAALRGKTVFDKAGCIRCHSGQYGTNLKQYDVGTGTGQDVGKKLDTPVLTELWRTAPYLNDGRAATVKEVLNIYNPGDKHGRTSGLSTQEIDDLAEYLLSF